MRQKPASSVKHKACGTEVTVKRMVSENYRADVAGYAITCPACRCEVAPADLDPPGPICFVTEGV